MFRFIQVDDLFGNFVHAIMGGLRRNLVITCKNYTQITFVIDFQDDEKFRIFRMYNLILKDLSTKKLNHIKFFCDLINHDIDSETILIFYSFKAFYFCDKLNASEHVFIKHLPHLFSSSKAYACTKFHYPQQSIENFLKSSRVQLNSIQKQLLKFTSAKKIKQTKKIFSWGK